MQRQMLKSKIHRATVTGVRRRLRRLDHDRPRADARGRPASQRAGPRLGHRQRRAVRHLRDRGRARVGERSRSTAPPRSSSARATRIIVASFAAYDERDLETYAPVVVHVDDGNEIVEVDSHPEVLLDSPLASEAIGMSARPQEQHRRASPMTPAAARRDEGRRRADRDGHRLRPPFGARWSRRPASTSSSSATPRR